MSPPRSLAALALLLTLLATTLAPGRAARPLLDQHQWDSYFAMFARDVDVPWKPATIRLDTYSGAPVDFAVYNVDPAAVIVAGQNRAPRALDTSKLRPLQRWHFDPPSGYRFVSSDVQVPLGTQEGFYVVEARRGEAVQQVWLNRTHIGLVTEESSQGLVLWAADLRSGRAIANMHVDFLVGLGLFSRATGRDGTVVWTDARRPSFALADQGAGRAFVSLLPSAPLPANLVGIRLAEGVVRAGGHLRAIGFARQLGSGGYRRASGFARIGVTAAGGRAITSTTVRLDAAGAFDADISLPASAPAGAATVLVTAGRGVAGTSVRIDAATDIALSVSAECPCDAARPLSIVVGASRTTATGMTGVPGVGLRMEVVRIPHVLPPAASIDAPRWGTTVVLERHLDTDASGKAKVTLLAPSDGLDSTYAVRVTTAGAVVTARIVVPIATVALSLEPDATTGDPGSAVGFTVRGFRVSDGAPAAGLAVRVRLSHGSTRRDTHVTLGADGVRRLSFPGASLGNNLAVAEASVADGKTVLDAASIDIAPRALSGASGSADADLTISTDRGRYGPHDRVRVQATAPGATGDALLSIAGARTYTTYLASVAGGRAGATLDLADAQGDVRVRAAFVRDGAIATGDVPIHVDGPGRARATELTVDRASYGPGQPLQATIRDGAGDGPGTATVALRVTDGRTDGSAYFGDAADVLLTGGTSTQAPASDNASWHAWIAPSRSKASDLFAADRPRTAPADVPTLGAAAPRTEMWQVARQPGEVFELAAPRRPGHYVLSVLKIEPGGDVGAAQTSFEVE